MSGFKRALRRKRTWIIILLLAFLIVDAAMVAYTFSYTTDSKQGELVQSGLLVSEATTSAFGSTVVLAEGSLYVYTPTGLLKLEGSENLTSFAFAYLSEVVALVTAERTLNFYEAGSTTPSFTKLMDSDTEVIAIREQASGNVYAPVDIAVVTSNQTGSYFIPLSVSGDGAPGTASALPGGMVSHASARSGGYITIACDDGSFVTFRTGRVDPVATIPYDGQIDDMVMGDNGMKVYVLFHGGSILAMKPSTGSVYGWTNLSAAVTSLVLGDDGESAYALDGDVLMSVSGASGVPFFSGQSITAFAIPGTNGYVICQNGEVGFYKQSREGALWESGVEGVCVGAETDFAATFILVWTDQGDLFSYDNSVPVVGAREWWMAIGVLLTIELVALVALAWGRTVSDGGSRGLVVLFAGAIAGLVVTIIFPNDTVVAWFGGELPVAAIVIASGAVAAFTAWVSGSGAWSVILGIITGSITAAVIGLITTFFLWASGMGFGEQDVFFTALVNSVPIGFTASIAGGIVGLIMAYALVPGEKKKARS